jgi:hypothetical protein
MSTPTDLGTRIRTGLRAAADALPDDRTVPTYVSTEPVGRRPAARWVSAAAAATLLVAGLGIAGLSARRADDGGASVNVPGGGVVAGAPTTRAVPAAVPPPPAGQAVVSGNEVHTFDAAGRPIGTMSLAPLDGVQSVASDRRGGWVACADFAAHAVRWLPAGREPVTVPAEAGVCVAGALHVVETEAGPTLVYPDLPGNLHAVVLATGARHEFPVPPETTVKHSWTAVTGRLLTHGDEGWRLYDLATGRSLPVARFGTYTGRIDLSLSPEATSVAVLSGDGVGPSRVEVFDLASGASRFSEDVTQSLEGGQVAYDGTRVAWGNWYADRGPVTVVDVATGARHTVDARGILPN